MPARPLTAGETALAKTVFGDSLDYKSITISDEKFMALSMLPEGTAMAPNGHLFMPGCYKDDYSKEDTYWKALFVHEMTHVWQYQNKVLAPMAEAVRLNLSHGFNYAAAYPYKLDEKKDLIDYNMEQQASIVQDYFAMKQEGFKYQFWGNCKDGHCDDAEKKRLFEKVLEKFHADPAYAKRDAFPTNPKLKPKKPKP
ncbi:MAG: hypothetical protein ACAH80_18305 [Alphaproteobacteria bacterium]